MPDEVTDHAGGGYDDGYRACPCFWGNTPSRLVRDMLTRVGLPVGARALDAGCGEGKNAGHLHGLGARVLAIDISEAAIQNAMAEWGSPVGLEWRNGDIRAMPLEVEQFDVVVAYGLLHCLRTEAEIREVVLKLQQSTRKGGILLLCAFNDRSQDLSAHPGFRPTLLRHVTYHQWFSDWEVMVSSDEDLTELHPHNHLPHTHSMTRLMCRRPPL